jgi:hypothetical protein
MAITIDASRQATRMTMETFHEVGTRPILAARREVGFLL